MVILSSVEFGTLGAGIYILQKNENDFNPQFLGVPADVGRCGSMWKALAEKQKKPPRRARRRGLFGDKVALRVESYIKCFSANMPTKTFFFRV